MKMTNGSLLSKHGTWYVVVSFKDEFGKPKQKWISTGLRVANNKTKAKQKNEENSKRFRPCYTNTIRSYWTSRYLFCRFFEQLFANQKTTSRANYIQCLYKTSKNNYKLFQEYENKIKRFEDISY